MRFLLLLGILSGAVAFGQEEDDHNFDYTVIIEIDGVTDLATAKPITDPIRYKYKQFPIFNDSTDQFEFVSIYNFSEEEISFLISENGYSLNTYFCIRIEGIQEEENNTIESE